MGDSYVSVGNAGYFKGIDAQSALTVDASKTAIGEFNTKVTVGGEDYYVSEAAKKTIDRTAAEIEANGKTVGMEAGKDAGIVGTGLRILFHMIDSPKLPGNQLQIR